MELGDWRSGALTLPDHNQLVPWASPFSSQGFSFSSFVTWKKWEKIKVSALPPWLWMLSLWFTHIHIV